MSTQKEINQLIKAAQLAKESVVSTGLAVIRARHALEKADEAHHASKQLFTRAKTKLGRAIGISEDYE